MAASDEDLLEAYARGEPAAFDAFYKRHAELLHRVLMVRLRSPADADDALQDVFLRVHRHIHRYDRALGGLSWVVTIARNAAIDALRRRRPGVALDAAAAAPGAVAVDAATGGALHVRATAAPRLEARQDLEQALSRLSPADRDLVLRRLVDDESFDDLARGTGASAAGARQRLSRVLRRLRSLG